MINGKPKTFFQLKLDAATLGGSKRSLSISIHYTNTRKQFIQPISNFGAIKHKLAEMAVRCLADESALYRTSKFYSQQRFRHGTLRWISTTTQRPLLWSGEVAGKE